jgi:purine-nucleoside phosphorylase
MLLAERIEEAVAAIRAQTSVVPRIALILGSGLGGLARGIDAQASLDYRSLPHFRTSGAKGHAGCLILGQLAGQQVVCMQGRLHPYEGYTPEEIAFPLRVMQALGAETLIVTNAAGGINLDFEVGEKMLITDHINFTGGNPLTFSEDQGTPVFVDMSYAYTPALRSLALSAAERVGVVLKEGTYLGLRGPNFETPAEIRAFRGWGADAVGMSTVYEVIAAASLGMQILGLSLITNMAAGVLDQPLTGEEVFATARLAASDMEALVTEILLSFAHAKH